MQSLPVMPATAAAQAPATPGVPRANAGERAADAVSAAGELLGFLDQLAQTVTFTEDLPAPVDPALVAVDDGAADAAPSEVPADPAQPLLAEQWLLGMQSQRQAVVEARAAAQTVVPWGEPARETMPGVASAAASAAGAALTPLGSDQLAQQAPLSAGDAPDAEAKEANVFPARAVQPQSQRAQVGAASRDAAKVPTETAAAPPLSVERQPPTGLAASVESAAAARAEPAVGGDAVDVVSAAPERTQPAQTVAQTLKLQAPEAKWGEQMLHALRDQVEVQLQQRVQQASIRLDPPELGALEIFLSHESGRLSVQLSAAHADVARLLQQTSERLRQELIGQNFVQVSVQVTPDGQQGQHGHARQRPPLPMADEAIGGDSGELTHTAERRGRHRDDVLVTV